MSKNQRAFSIKILPGTIPAQVRDTVSGNYRILSYDPSILSFDNEEAKLYTSVVVDSDTETDTYKIVAYSMPKPQDLSTLESNISGVAEYHFEEMIEGTMVNLFYNRGKWEIATRNAVGGGYWFYRTQYDAVGNPSPKRRQTTFLEMFVEALGYSKGTALEEVSFLTELDPAFSYSFILQHPENHIVQTFAFPHLYLVGVFKCEGQTVVQIPASEYRQWKVFQNATMPIEFPRIWDSECYTTESYEKARAEILGKCDMGSFLVCDSTGDRAVIENTNYARLKELRGNNPNLQYQFLCMYYIGKVEEFLHHFPMYKYQFHRFMKQYNDFVAQVQNTYYQYYVLKVREQMPKKYFIHAAAIHHAVYIPSIKPYSESGKIVVTKRVVDEYFKKVEPQKMLYYLNLEV